MDASDRTWTPERVEQLKVHVSAGLSCAQIAREIGVTRNAVIGKINRLGLSGLKPPSAPKPKVPKDRSPRYLALRQIFRVVRPQGDPAAEPPPLVDEAPFMTSEQRCSLLELSPVNCRWPINDPGAANFAFCGLATVPGLPYCTGHARLAYRRVASR
jgi:GcrA cell cycle regulator